MGTENNDEQDLAAEEGDGERVAVRGLNGRHDACSRCMRFGYAMV
jgi:hypothetical protein